jgi:hypothetical protein
MSRKISRYLALVTLLFISSSLFAQNNRSAVSVGGSDLNTCTTVDPCRSFGVAMSHTNAGGEIIALDTAGYGPFIVNKAVTVSGAPGVHAAITTTSGTGISVNAAGTDHVVLRNLVLIGAGGSSGIDINPAGEVRVIGCTIRGFQSFGIQASSGNLTVDHSAIIDNVGAFGIDVGNTNPATTTHHTVTNTLIQGNNTGLAAEQHTAVVMANCTITGNNSGAQSVSNSGTGAVNADLALESCTIAHNSGGVFAGSSGGNNLARVFISQNVIAFNGTGVSKSGSAVVSSFNNNRFVLNGTDGGPFTLVAFQ